jgi:hypothetical protein
MKADELKEKAKKLGLKVAPKAKKVEIVRAIQTAEGNNACYQTGMMSGCSQNQCCWREDCV